MNMKTLENKDAHVSPFPDLAPNCRVRSFEVLIRKSSLSLPLLDRLKDFLEIEYHVNTLI